MKILWFTRKAEGRHIALARSQPARGNMVGAFTLVEQVVALAIAGVGLVSTMQAISYLEFENRASSQRMLAASIQMEILELFKTQPFDQLTASPLPPLYLKQDSTGAAGLARWVIPTPGTDPYSSTLSGTPQALPVESVLSSSAADPPVVAGKLPSATWRWTSRPDPTDATNTNLRQITVIVEWKTAENSTRSEPLRLYASTIISKFTPKL